MLKQIKEGFEVENKQKEDFLQLCCAQLNKWELTMPYVEPLLLDFGLKDFMNIGESEFWICNIPEEGYCGKYIFLFEGQRCPNHYHKIKHETFNVIKGKVMMTVAGRDFALKEGAVFSMNVESEHTFIALDGAALILEVSRPCFPMDSFFSNSDIGIL